MQMTPIIRKALSSWMSYGTSQLLLSEDLRALGKSSDKHVAAGPPLNFQLPQYFLSRHFLGKSLTFWSKQNFALNAVG